MTLRWIGFFELRDEPGFQHDAAGAVATLLPVKGQRGYALGGAWCRFKGIEVFHSIKTMLRKPHKVVAERSGSRIDTKKLDLKSNCATSTPYIVLRISHY